MTGRRRGPPIVNSVTLSVGYEVEADYSVQASSGYQCTAIVVNFNGGLFLRECLESLAAQSAPGIQLEVVVVDNGSTDGSEGIVEDDFPGMTLIRSSENLGFGGGVNLALAHTVGDLVVLINNDAVAEPGFIEAVTAPFLRENSTRLAAVTARIILSGRFTRLDAGQPEPGGTSTYVSPSGERWARLPDGVDEPAGNQLTNSTGNQISASGNGRDRSWLVPVDQDTSPETVFGFCGGGAALRREALTDVGDFDARLFMYYEDTDLSWRLRRAGWDIGYAADARVIHRHAASSGIRSRFFLTHNIRNRILVTARNGTPAMFRAAILRTLGSVLKATVRGLTSRSHSDSRVQARAGILAILAAARLLPAYRRAGNRLDKSSVLERNFIKEWVVSDHV